MQDRIIVMEHQCYGFEHVPFNAALIYTIHLAYPSAIIEFFGEKKHLFLIKEKLDRLDLNKFIDYHDVVAPTRHVLDWRRLPVEFALCAKVIDRAVKQNAKALIFASVTNSSLMALKILGHYKNRSIPMVAVVHGCLSSIVENIGRKPWKWLIGLRHVLAMPHPSNMRLVVLGEAILRNVIGTMPKTQFQWRSMNIVDIWPSASQHPESNEPSGVGPIKFGFVGVTNASKGFDVFCRLAESVCPEAPSAQFVMVGFYKGPRDQKPNCQYLSNIPDKPVPRNVYESLMKELSFVVWTATPNHYRFTASATFLDALAFLKPGIYLRNDYIQSYFDIMGDIGYLCDSYEEMRITIRQILSAFPKERYRRQVENIRRGRVLFEPRNQAQVMRRIIESVAMRAK